MTNYKEILRLFAQGISQRDLALVHCFHVLLMAQVQVWWK